MDKDIVPELLELLQNEYKELIKENSKLKDLLSRVTDETATLLDAQKYSEEVGRILQKIFSSNINEDVLPDGKFYYNIAQRLLEPLLRGSYKDVADYCYDAQKLVNVANNIGLNPVQATYSSGRVNGIIDYVSNADTYSQVEKSFVDSLMNYSQSIYDDFIQSNAEFKYYSGMAPKIIRVAVGKACKWCRELEGSYKYPNVPKDVYRRHENCYCTVTYEDGKRYKDVWSKQFVKNPKEIENKIQFSQTAYNGKVRAIRGMANGPRRGALTIVDEVEQKHLIKIANDLNIPENVLIFNQGRYTGYSDRLNAIYVRGDVFPSEFARNIDSILNERCALAHEYYGHYLHHNEFEKGDWRDEYWASRHAAIDTPNLTDDERRLLMIDAFDRMKEAGVFEGYDDEAKRYIYGY